MHWDHQLTPHPAFHLRQAFGGQVGHPLPIGWGYVFSVAAAILAAVEGGILPPGKNDRFFRDPQSAGRLEELFRRAGCTGSTAGETPAATLNTYGWGEGWGEGARFMGREHLQELDLSWGHERWGETPSCPVRSTTELGLDGVSPHQVCDETVEAKSNKGPIIRENDL